MRYPTRIALALLAALVLVLAAACEDIGEEFEDAAPDDVEDPEEPDEEDDPDEVAEPDPDEAEDPEPDEDTADAQASCADVAFDGDSATVAYMPPATEFPYYMAIEQGLEARAEELGHETFTLAPLEDNVEEQIGMFQDVLQRDPDAVVLSTHDEQAAAPLVEQMVDAGIAVAIVNTDIPDFPTPIHAVVGYVQRDGTYKLGQHVAEEYGTDFNVGLIEGVPGYHSDERIGGFVDAIEEHEGFEIIETLPGDWNIEGGNDAGMDMLQSHPEIDLIMAANDYMAIGANAAAESLGQDDVLIFGNDGDTQGLEEIAAGDWEATVMTFPFDMGEDTMQVIHDCLTEGEVESFFHEIPTEVVEEDEALELLQQPERLYPEPAQEY